MKIPKDVETIISALEAKGHRAYAVGGCVRDSLMGAEPYDWDICTSALPEETKAAFHGKRMIDTGLQHGTVTLLLGGKPYEITTFRTDGKYSDARRPDSVSFVGDVALDLSRRDFTINAMAYSPESGVIDLFGGRDDLAAGLIRAVGDPEERFSEDALRIMRAVRFAACLGFDIERKTADAMRKKRGMLQKIARERITAELRRMLLGKAAEKTLIKYGDIINEILPGTAACREWPQLCRAAALAPEDFPSRLGIIISGTGNEKIKNLVKSLKLDNPSAAKTEATAYAVHKETPAGRADAKRYMNRHGAEEARSLLKAKRAYCIAFGGDGRAEETAEAEVLDILSKGEAYCISDLAVNGSDLKAAGISEGRAVGETLRTLLGLVTDGKIPNAREDLIAEAARMKNGPVNKN